MKDNNKYSMLWSVLLIVLMIHLLYPISYSIRVNSNRRNQKTILLSASKEQYEVLRISNSVYKKALRDEGKELNINGEMYDIVSTELLNDEVLCTVLPDKKETSYHQQLANKLHKDKKQEQNKRVVSWSPALYFTISNIQWALHYMSAPNHILSDIALISDGHEHRIIKPPQAV